MQGYKYTCDVWGCGIILFICLCGYPPFSEGTEEKPSKYPVEQQITEGRLKFQKQHWLPVSAEGKEITRKLLTVDPHHRQVFSGGFFFLLLLLIF